VHQYLDGQKKKKERKKIFSRDLVLVTDCPLCWSHSKYLKWKYQHFWSQTRAACRFVVAILWVRSFFFPSVEIRKYIIPKNINNKKMVYAQNTRPRLTLNVAFRGGVRVIS